MIDRYNIELTPDYLNNVCTADKRFGMYPTIEMIEKFNEINSNHSILPDTEQSRIRALFAELIPQTAEQNFIETRFIKLCGYKNTFIPLSKRFSNLGEIGDFIRNIAYTHDIVNYDKFARMIEVIANQENIPVDFDKYEKWQIDKTDTPNETITTENETTNTTNISDTTETDGTVTKAISDDTTSSKTGTEALQKTGTDTKTLTKTGTISEAISNTKEMDNTETTSETDYKTMSETKTETIAPFDSTNFNNDRQTETSGSNDDQLSKTVSNDGETTETGTKTTTNNTTDTEQLTHLTTDTTTYNIQELNNNEISDTTTTDNTIERTATNTETGEKSETKTRIGENEATENGERWTNNGLSLEDLLNREIKLIPIFDTYLMSIAREITLTCIDNVW